MLRLSSVERNNKRLRAFEKQYRNTRPTHNASFITFITRHSLTALICFLIFGYTTLELYSSLTMPLIYPDIPSDEIISPPTEFTASRKVNTFRTTESATQHCQFTKQGTKRVCDSLGTICSRSAVSKDSSCCRALDPASALVRHSCRGCDAETGCCGDYETCVSCCLRPDHVALHSSRTYTTSELGIPNDILAVLSSNDFEWCEYVCRTSSRSLLPAENSYSSSLVRYCHRLDSHAPIDLTGVNSDRASSCLKPKPGSVSGEASDHSTSSVTHDATATTASTASSITSTPLCLDDEHYPIMQKPRPRTHVLRDYG